MSSERRSVGSSSLEQLARSCRYVLVDFDGPMSDVFAGLPAPLVAKRLRGLVENHGLVDALVDSDDPMQVLHVAKGLPPAQRAEIERALRLAEVEAVASSKPTPGADRLLAACERTGRAVAVVSNNSDEAVRAYLTMHELDPFVAVVSARRSSDPALMKPNPYLVDQAVLELAAEPAACVLVGDTLTDIEAAAAAGVRSVGYANKPGKSGAMAIAGADVIITAMDELTQAISHS
jgi:HAD superfamily hydrolase (TIGR01509 family)